jgi:FkbM family methyltransferase
MEVTKWQGLYKWQVHDTKYFPQDFRFLWPKGDEKLHGDIPTLAHLDEHVFPLVKDKSIAVQAGGAMGMWAKRMSQLFAQVYTFEPNPQSAYCCSFNCPEENVHVYNAALGCERQFVKVGTPGNEINYGANHVIGAGAVPTIVLDDWNFQVLNLLMLDIEGYELFALTGAIETIKRCRPVIVLEDKGCSREYGYHKGKVETFLKSNAGYETHSRFHGGRDVILIPNEQNDNAVTENS